MVELGYTNGLSPFAERIEGSNPSWPITNKGSIGVANQ